MKVLIYSYPSETYSQFIMETNICLKHIENKDDINFLFFIKNNSQKYIPGPDGLSQIKIDENKINYVVTDNEPIILEGINSVEDLKEFKIDNADIGLSVLSTLIAKYKEPNPDITQLWDECKLRIVSAISVYKSTMSCLEKLKPDIFYLYNGDLNSFRPALRAAQKLGIKTLVYSSSKEPNHFFFVENNPINDFNSIKKQITECWENYQSTKDRENLAKSYFVNKRLGVDLGSQIKGQKKGILPKDFDNSKKNIVIFNSSEDELKTIDLTKDSFIKSQSEAIKFIAENTKDKDIHFYLRVHPALKGRDNSYTKEISLLKHPNLTVISADSMIDTYTLMASCEKVIVFGSSLGVEACCWNIPVILIGKALYDELDVCYIAKSYQDTLNLIKKTLEPKPPENAFKYGYYEKTKGIRMDFFRHELLSSMAYFYFYQANLSFLAAKDPVTVLNEYNLAYTFYKSLPDANKSPVFLSLLLEMIRVNLLFKNYHDVIKYASELIAIEPEIVVPLLLLAKAYESVSNFSDAVVQYKKILEVYHKQLKLKVVHPYHSDQNFFINLYLQLGRCCLLAGNNQEGIKYLEESEKISKSNSNFVYLYILRYYLINNNLEKAIDYYFKANKDIGLQEKKELYKTAKTRSEESINLELDLLLYLNRLKIWFKEELIEIRNKMDEVSEIKV